MLMKRLWSWIGQAVQPQPFSIHDQEQIVSLAQGHTTHDLRPLYAKALQANVPMSNPYMGFLQEVYTPVPDLLLRRLRREALVAHHKPPAS